MLKKEHSLLSTRSLKSNKSHKSILTDKSSVVNENIKEFEVCFPALCCQYGFTREVHVKKEYKEDEYYKHLQVSEAGKRRRTILGLHSPHTDTETHENKETVTTTDADNGEPVLDLDAIILAAMYDVFNRLVEIFLYKIDVPRELIQILTFVARYYNDLKRIKIQLCKKVNGATILEISKLLSVSSITEVDLDGSYCKEGNYGVLFDSGRLMNVSLTKCCINDEICQIIASKITLKGPAAKSLYSLSLSSNLITDVGAISLAKALRSNRKLRYLNLAANHITDTGAGCILDSLKEFPLTPEENFQRCKRYMDYERLRMIYYWRFLHDSDSRSDDTSKKTNGKKKSTAFNRNKISTPKETKRDQSGRSQRDSLQHTSRSPSQKTLKSFEDKKNRAQIFAGEMVGPFQDPFQSTNVTIREGTCFSKGNMSLCYLNLAFNNLGYHSVVKLLDVLKYQNETKAIGQYGLVRAIIKGNNMPKSCIEYVKVDELLIKSMKSTGGRAFTDSANTRRKSRASSVVPF